MLCCVWRRSGDIKPLNLCRLTNLPRLGEFRVSRLEQMGHFSTNRRLAISVQGDGHRQGHSVSSFTLASIFHSCHP